jgi:hypothetical protein
VFKRTIRVFYAPVRDRASRVSLVFALLRLEAEFVTPYVEADVKWLVKIGLDPEGVGVPRFGRGEVRNPEDGRVYTFKLNI